MATVKTCELTKLALNWAVAKCGGERYGPPTFRVHQNSKGATVYLNAGMQQSGIPYRPSADWSQGGPIIERERLQVTSERGGTWVASAPHVVEMGGYRKYCFNSGPTPLIAAMRCYVTSKLGETVEIPNELLE